MARGIGGHVETLEEDTLDFILALPGFSVALGQFLPVLGFWFPLTQRDDYTRLAAGSGGPALTSRAVTLLAWSPGREQDCCPPPVPTTGQFWTERPGGTHLARFWADRLVPSGNCLRTGEVRVSLSPEDTPPPHTNSTPDGGPPAPSECGHAMELPSSPP